MRKLIFVTGASGAGKTVTLEALEAAGMDGVVFCYFDRIGVPPIEDMVREFGSGEEWQKQMTIRWVHRIKNEHSASDVVILDGQARQAFIDHACQLEGIDNYEIVLFDCADDVRNARLIRRGHPELVNEQMRIWARCLRQWASERGETIVDTTHLSLQQASQRMQAIIQGASTC